jgi:predicted homoserine dehydrogenase-like protein
LKAGEVLDGSGGYTVDGLIEKAEIAQAENLLPLGLAYDAKRKCHVSQGEAISCQGTHCLKAGLVLRSSSPSGEGLTSAPQRDPRRPAGFHKETTF